MDTKTEKRWGIVALGSLMFLVSLLFGSKGSPYTLVWMIVAYYGYKGNLSSIKLLMKWLCLINLIALVIVLLFVSDDIASNIPNISGKTGLALGILIMLIPKILLYFYVVFKINKSNLVSPKPSQFIIKDLFKNITSYKKIFIFTIFLILILIFFGLNTRIDDLPKNNLTGNVLTNSFNKSDVKNSEWIFIEMNEQQGAKIQYFYDKNNIEKISSSNYVLNIAYVFDELVHVVFDGETIGNVRYAKSLVEINCIENKVKRIKSDIFGSKLTDANQVRLNSRSKEADKDFENRDYVKKLCSVW